MGLETQPREVGELAMTPAQDRTGSMKTERTPADWSSLALLERFQGGEDRAADEIFARYFERLTLLARSRLSARLASRTDPEDIVMSVYRSFFLDARAGRFALARGGDLWRLLAAMTRHKLLKQVRHHTADRRSVAVERSSTSADGVEVFGPSRDPTPEDAVGLADELEWVASRLEAFGRRVLELRLQGAQLSEIATDTGRSERTIRRTLAEIRALMAGRFDDERP